MMFILCVYGTEGEHEEEKANDGKDTCICRAAKDMDDAVVIG